jgi:two-component system, OmpR family, sensor kinase
MDGLLDRIPLRIKLVAAVLALVAAALLVISVASTIALRSYLIAQTDNQLSAMIDRLEVLTHRMNPGELPSTIVGGVLDAGGWTPTVAGYTSQQLPPLPASIQDAVKMAGHPYFVLSSDRKIRWRVLIEAKSNDSIVLAAADMTTMDHAVERLTLAELLIGAGVLMLLAVLGAALVRASLGPLRQIEHTALAIADGDLTERIPDFEPGNALPRTEVGRLGRALNTMLGQIEAAFTARAASETAARAAESAARDAAEAAGVSEVRARRSEERMRQFVADASHELRTPLTTIRGFAELYRQGAVSSPEDIQRVVRRIEEEAARMGLLVEDLLLLARMDEQRPLAQVPLELRVIANDAVAAARVMAPDREITLDIPDGTGPLVVSGDESRLRQVVGNLMTNALMHTPSGTPVSLRLRAEGDAAAVIEVADAGPGLPPEQSERIFERFYRVDAARTRRTGGDSSGTGLGLAIVAALVAAHGGTVEVDSVPGQGATFRVRLPAIPDQAD